MSITTAGDMKLRQAFRKNIKLYIQSRDVTCSAAVALMVLHYYFTKEFPLKTSEELRIFNNIKFKKYEYGNFPKMALLFAKNNLDTKFVFFGPDYTHPLFKKSLFRDLAQEYELSLKRLNNTKHLSIIQKDFQVFDIITDLVNGYLVVAEITYPDEELTHTILIRGFRGRKIYFLDPIHKNGGRHCYYKDLESRLNLKTLKNYIAIKPLNT